MFMFLVCKYIQKRKAGAKLYQETLQEFQNKKYGDQKEKKLESFHLFTSFRMRKKIRVGFKNGVGPFKMLPK